MSLAPKVGVFRPVFVEAGSVLAACLCLRGSVLVLRLVLLPQSPSDSRPGLRGLRQQAEVVLGDLGEGRHVHGLALGGGIFAADVRTPSAYHLFAVNVRGPPDTARYHADRWRAGREYQLAKQGATTAHLHTAAVRCDMVLHRVFRARHVRNTGIGGEV